MQSIARSDVDLSSHCLPDRADPDPSLVPEDDITMTAACIETSRGAVFDCDGTTRTMAQDGRRNGTAPGWLELTSLWLLCSLNRSVLRRSDVCGLWSVYTPAAFDRCFYFDLIMAHSKAAADLC